MGLGPGLATWAECYRDPTGQRWSDSPAAGNGDGGGRWQCPV
jgi:hypothetical protein